MELFGKATARPPRWLAILLVSLAGLLLEVGYTRVISYKLWYFYTYLVIGLSLLGIGSGGILVTIWAPLRRAATERVIALGAMWGAVSIAVGFFVVARLPINTYAIWDYGEPGSFGNFALLALICLVVFATFIAIGVIVATLLGRAGGDVGRLYFADLIGAGVGCLLAVPLNARLGPPTVIIVSALVLAVVALLWLPDRRSLLFAGAGVVTVALAASVLFDGQLIPKVRPETTKFDANTSDDYSRWGPVFRVDVTPPLNAAGGRMLIHDGTYGSGLWPFDGDVDSLTRYETDSRAIPFRILGDPPEHELIIGSAGGNEILASLFYDAPNIEAVELNPVTVDLLTGPFADETGHLPDLPQVHMQVGDGRSYLARSDGDYDLVWFVAPDSYAATNAASSGAFVLSESYLYTTDMIEETLDHLSDDGLMVVQFGELTLDRPNRTSRYIVTARQALENAGIEDPSQHLLVAAQVGTGRRGPALSTIVIKRGELTASEIERFTTGLDEMTEAGQEAAADGSSTSASAGEPDPRGATGEEHLAIYAPDGTSDDSMLAGLAGGTDDEVAAIIADYPRDISAVSDDAPFFWHFAPFHEVLANITNPINIFVGDPEVVIGERVLLLLLGLATAYAGVFLLLPFATVRKTWSALPAKPTSAVYFACLGLGFMFYEVTMIQRLVRFLGYPTYSLTVTLASILISTGLGALLSRRLADRSRSVMPVLWGALAALTLFYQFGLDPLMDSLLSQGLTVRVVFSLLVLAPLGLCLGMFMPFGLGLVSRMAGEDRAEEYVAWSWAVNGFFSVIGSVLTTILSMAVGFRLVQYLALGVYAVAAVVFVQLHRRAASGSPMVVRSDEAEEAGVEAEAASGVPAPAAT